MEQRTKMLKFIFTVTVAISIGQLVIAVGGENKNQLITEDDFTNLSEIRVRTIKFPVETKCKLYQAKLREIFADEHGDSLILFAKAINYLMQKESPIRNPQAVINDMVQCQTSATLQQLENAGPQQRDNQCEARIEALRRELVTAKQLAEQSKLDAETNATVERIQAELQAKQVLLDEANESLKHKDLELEEAKQSASSEQSELGKQLEERRLEVENKLQAELREKQMLLDEVSESLRQKNLELEKERTKQSAASEKYGSIEKLYEGETATVEALRAALQDKQKQIDESNESLRRKDLELTETKQSSARQRSELTRRYKEERLVAENRTQTNATVGRIQAELRAKQVLLDEANDSLKQKSLELDGLRAALDSSWQKLNQCEQAREDKDRKEAADRVRQQEELRRKEDEKQRIRIEEEQRLREEKEREIREEEKQRLRKEEEQRQREEEKQRLREEEEQEIGNFGDQCKVLYSSMVDDNIPQRRCAKYLKLFNMFGKITKRKIEAVTRLGDSELMKVIDTTCRSGLYSLSIKIQQQYNMNDVQGKRIKDEVLLCGTNGWQHW